LSGGRSELYGGLPGTEVDEIEGIPLEETVGYKETMQPATREQKPFSARS
jgi:hypothetical protein